MKIAFVTDIHAYAFNDFSSNINCYWNEETKRYTQSESGDLVLNSRLFNILSGLCDMRDFCVRQGISVVINGGDTYHKRSILDVVTFNCTHKVLESFKDAGIRQIIISGNHDDAINADNSPSSVETFKSFADVVTEPEVIEIEYYGEFVNICCLPWMKTKQKSLEFIDECLKDKNSTNVLVAHLGVSGASLGSGYIMSDDYSLSELKPDKWKYVLLGHYHAPQCLHENTIYGGSPLQNDFGDEGSPHGFWVVDTSKRWDMEMFHLEYPEFVTLTADEVKSYPKDLLEYNYIRVQATAKDVEKVQNELGESSDVRIEIEKDYTKNVRSNINVTMTQEEIVKTYVTEAHNNDESLPVDALIKKGTEIIRKVGVAE